MTFFIEKSCKAISIFYINIAFNYLNNLAIISDYLFILEEPSSHFNYLICRKL